VKNCRLKQFFLRIPRQIGPQPNCGLTQQSFELSGVFAHHFPRPNKGISSNNPDFLIGFSFLILLPEYEEYRTAMLIRLGGALVNNGFFFLDFLPNRFKFRLGQSFNPN
jgi:hypothetical protein